MDETRLLEALGEDNYDKVGTRLPMAKLEELGVLPAAEVPSWRMTLGNFRKAYPHGKVFINDYREFPELKRPIRSLYDKIIDTTFDRAIFKHNTSNFMLFPTIQNVDPRLDAKQRVFGFNVRDEFACLTEEYVAEGKNGVRNFELEGVPLVASWDPKHETLGIFKRPSKKPIYKNVDVYGIVNDGNKKNPTQLDRLETVKAGLFWFVWQEFFPQTQVNPGK